jgi:hypothetical protein
VVAAWLTAVAVGSLKPRASLAEAEDWFFGRLRDELPTVAPTDVAAPQLECSAEQTFALLPYVLDRHRPGTRREALRAVDSSADRKRRKQQGVYYTPGDVAETMVRLLGAKLRGTVLDPACGTGVFLRAAVAEGTPTQFVYGIDIDEQAIEAAVFVVLATAIRRSPSDKPPWILWHELRLNFACLNSLALVPGGLEPERELEVEDVRERLRAGVLVPLAVAHRSPSQLGLLFPALSEGAGVVLSNPPYAPLGASASIAARGDFAAYEGESRPTARTEAGFTEFLWRLTTADGAGSLVLPLSLATSSRREFARVRQRIEGTPGRWSFAFFDRAPDALFGDDVKTRNVILLYEASPEAGAALQTTPLLRWTSRNRATVLRNLTFTPIELKLANCIPKVGTVQEAALYGAIRALKGRLGDSVVAAGVALPEDFLKRGARSSVFVAPTAYNWISVARDCEPLARGGHTSESGMRELVFADEQVADAAFAVLSSKLVLWLWRAESDGFHVTSAFMLGLPFSLARLAGTCIESLATLGAALWQQALDRPTLSMNRGRRSVAYATSTLPLSASVDETVVQAFGLPTASNDAIRDWHQNLLIVDWAEPRRIAAATARTSVA